MFTSRWRAFSKRSSENRPTYDSPFQVKNRFVPDSIKRGSQVRLAASVASSPKPRHARLVCTSQNVCKVAWRGDDLLNHVGYRNRAVVLDADLVLLRRLGVVGGPPPGEQVLDLSLAEVAG